MNYISIIKQKIIPSYYQESILTLLLDFLVDIFLVLVFAPFIKDETSILWFLIIVIIAYNFTSFLLTQLLSIIIFYDFRKKKSVFITGKIIKWKEELSWSGWLWHSTINKFHPKELNVLKIKVLIELPNGKKRYIRTIMSFNRRILLNELFIKNNTEVKISYMKNSKVLLSIFDVQNIDDKKRFTNIIKFNTSL